MPSVVLKWNPATPQSGPLGSLSYITGYQLWKALEVPSNFTNFVNVANTVLTYTDTEVSDDTSYYYYVTAGDNLNNITQASNILGANLAIPPFETTVIEFTSGDESDDPFGNSGEGWYDGTFGLEFACGSLVTVPPTWGTGTANGIWFSNPESGNEMNFAAQGNFPQNYFSEMSIFFPPSATVTFFTDATIAFSNTEFSGFTVWTWSTGLSFPFTNGHEYATTFHP